MSEHGLPNLLFVLATALQLESAQLGHCGAHCISGLPAGGKDPHSYPQNATGTMTALHRKRDKDRRRQNSGSCSISSHEVRYVFKVSYFIEKTGKSKIQLLFSRRIVAFSDSRWFEQFILVRNWLAPGRKLLAPGRKLFCGRA